jgi:hypothetical protein
VAHRDLSDRRAQRGSEDYVRIGDEFVEWVRAPRTSDLRGVGEEGTNYSLLVESLLVRWLDGVGYLLEEC